MRVCSLLPSATEMVFALGQGDSLVGVTHECDYPAAAGRLPRVTRSNIPTGLSSAAIDQAVTSSLQTAGSLYELDLPLLDSLRPDLILTQRLCDVCAVSFDHVQDAVAGLKSKPRVLNLEPHSLSDIFDNILTVGQAMGADAAAKNVVDALLERVDAVRCKTKDITPRPRVFCLEWADPPYCGGHWMKELVEIAGGRDDLSHHHKPSYRIEWAKVLEFAPEIVVLTCCGFDLERNKKEGALFLKLPGAMDLPAARGGRIYATDGSDYFARPGPRIVEGLEILAHLIHPQLFPPPPLQQAFAPLMHHL